MSNRSNRARWKARLRTFVKEAGGPAKVAKVVGASETSVRQWCMEDYSLPSMEYLAGLRRAGMDLNKLVA